MFFGYLASGELITSNEVLLIDFASTSTDGQYECIADNGIDSKLKMQITIKVNGKSNEIIQMLRPKFELLLKQ